MSDDPFFASLRGSVTAAVAVLAFIAVLVGGGYYVYRWAAPRYEEAQRKTYEESRQHVEGTVQDLMRYRVKYQSAEPGHKKALRQLILRRATDVDRAELPGQLRKWIDTLKAQQSATP